MSKKISYFWLSLSILYVLIELSFRSDVISMSASSADTNDLLGLEHVGRVLSSFGFGLFFMTLLRTNDEHSSKEKRNRRLLMLPVFIVAYMASSNLQSWAITTYAENTAPSMKRDMLLANLYRDALYFSEQQEHQGRDWFHSDEQIRLSLAPMMAWGNPGLESISQQAHDLIPKLNNAKMQQNAAISDARVFDQHRKWMQTLNYQYESAVLESRDASGMYPDEAKQAYAYFTSAVDKRLQRAAQHSATTWQFPTAKDYQAWMEKQLQIVFRYRSTPSLINEDIIDGISLRKDYRIAQVLLGQKPSLSDDDLFWSSIHQSLQPAYVFDYNLSQLRESIRIQDLRKYYQIGDSLKDVCSSKPASKNDIFLILGHSPQRVIGTGMSSAQLDSVTPKLHTYITGQSAKTHYQIQCDYSYERTRGALNNLYAYMKNRVPEVNPALSGQLLGLSQSARRGHILYKHAAMSEFSKIMHDRKEELLLTQFDSLTAYNQFVDSLDLSSAQAFRNSVHRAKKQIRRTKLLEKLDAYGLDFRPVMKTRTDEDWSFGDFYTDPGIRAIFKKQMPEVFMPDGQFIGKVAPQYSEDYPAFLKQVSEDSKRKIRSLYSNAMSESQIAAIESSDAFLSGGRMADAGNQIAKGFIAPAFVLFVSNILITLTLVNIVTTALTPYIGAFRWLLAPVLATVLILPALLIKNDHLHADLPAKDNPRIVLLTNFTANTQHIYDILLPELIRPNWLYRVIKRANTPKEKFTQF